MPRTRWNGQGFARSLGTPTITPGGLVSDTITTDTADSADAEAEPRNALGTGLGRQLKLLSLWHLVGAAVSVVGILLARRGGDIELPWMPRYALQGFFSFAFVAHMASAYGIGARARWVRPLSLAVNYLLTLVAAAATLHLFNAFRALGDLGEGLYKAFVPFGVICVGLLWVLLSGQMLTNRPTAVGPQRLRTAGWSVAGLASVWFVLKADPSGLILSIGDSLTRPLALGAIALTVGAALATRLMWSRAAAKHFGSTRATDEALSGLAFLSPNLLGFLIFFAFPLLFSLWVSFFDWDTTNTTRDFIGLENYIRALSIDFAHSSQSNSGTEVKKGWYQVLPNLDCFCQHSLIGARHAEYWIK